MSLRDEPSSSDDEAFGSLLRRAARVSTISVDALFGRKRASGLKRGRRITPSIELVRPLGQGGMGCVWLAHHDGLHAEVAVKFMAPIAKERVAARARRLAREARLAARVRNPHVVQIFDHGTTDDGVPYIVMERLEGESLAERLERDGPLSMGEVVLLVRQVAEALTAAHACGVIHRDIKPGNLFLVKSGYELFVKVLDFGLAKPIVVDDALGVTRTGLFLGTPGYMSPEQLIDGKRADARSDLWALAVVTYECLTCKLPFEGRTVAALGHSLGDGALIPPSRRRRELRLLDAWFTRALARNPKARFPTAGELTKSLEACLGARSSSWMKTAAIALATIAALIALSEPWVPRVRVETGFAIAPPTVVVSNEVAPPPALVTAAPPPVSRPRMQPRPSPSASSRPAHCSDPQKAFTEDAEGYAILRPECL